MTIVLFVEAVLIAVVFVGWVIVGNATKVGYVWVTMLVCTGTFVSAAACAGLYLNQAKLPSRNAVLVLLVIGLINGIAVFRYAVRTNDPEISVGALVVTVSVLMAVLAPVLDWGLNGNIPSVQRAVGFAMAAASIYMLSR